MMQTIVREIRGIPYFLLQEYLQELGGNLIAEDTLAGEGWMARLERMEPFCIGSLSVGQTRLTIEIEDRLVEDFLVQFGQKTLRAGG